MCAKYKHCKRNRSLGWFAVRFSREVRWEGRGYGVGPSGNHQDARTMKTLVPGLRGGGGVA